MPRHETLAWPVRRGVQEPRGRTQAAGQGRHGRSEKGAVRQERQKEYGYLSGWQSGKVITMDEREKRKKEILTPLLVEAGAALIDCQGFEYGLALLLLHFSRLGLLGLDENSLRAVLDGEAKATAGQLARQFRDRFEVGPALEPALSDALSARNFIIHRFFVENLGRVVSPSGRQAVVRELRRLRALVRKADALLRPLIHGLGKALDGFDAAAFEQDTWEALFRNEETQEEARREHRA